MPTDIQRLTAATQALNAIETPQDAVNVIGMAELARRLARTAKLGTEAENAATAIRLKAEIRLAETVTEGQKKGQIAAPGDNQVPRNAGDLPKATLRDLGVSSQRLSEARDIASTMGPADVDALVEEAGARDQSLSRAAVVKSVRQKKAKQSDEFWERAEKAVFTEAEMARRVLDPLLIELVPLDQAVRKYRAYLTDQDRQRLERHVASLVESLRQDAGLEVVK